jgi:hypothetical protein
MLFDIHNKTHIVHSLFIMEDDAHTLYDVYLMTIIDNNRSFMFQLKTKEAITSWVDSIRLGNGDGVLLAPDYIYLYATNHSAISRKTRRPLQENVPDKVLQRYVLELILSCKVIH